MTNAIIAVVLLVAFMAPYYSTSREQRRKPYFFAHLSVWLIFTITFITLNNDRKVQSLDFHTVPNGVFSVQRVEKAFMEHLYTIEVGGTNTLLSLDSATYSQIEKGGVPPSKIRVIGKGHMREILSAENLLTKK